MAGDGYCNDETNNRHCSFDRGDCCYNHTITKFCSKCQCLTGDIGDSINNVLIGDGYCHDELNNPESNYDGGDCCGSCVITWYCENCTCLGPDTWAVNALLLNGICNDETNKEV